MWSYRRTDKLLSNDICHHFFKGKTVFFIHCHEEKRKHDRYHQDGCDTGTDWFSHDQIKRNSHNCGK